jgi:alpha-glucosidase
MAEYCTDQRLHMGYSFELLTDDFSAATSAPRSSAGSDDAEGWPCWAISNHDVRRAVTRWGTATRPAMRFAQQLVALVCSLRGSVCLYQGEELGLREADVPYEALQDPYGMAFWPNFKGRDGCRTPMPWDAIDAGRLHRRQPVAAVAAAHLHATSPRRTPTPPRCSTPRARSCAGASAAGAGHRRDPLPRCARTGAGVRARSRRAVVVGGVQPVA